MKTLKNLCPIALSALTLFSASGCFAFQEKKIASADLGAAYTRTATATMSVTDDFKNNFTDFSLSLFRETLTKDEKNDLLSPLSAALCLALVNNGANGNTRAQIENLFHMDTDTLNKSLYAYTSGLYSADDCKVNLANSIWLRQNALNVKPSFLQSNADWYGAQAYATPFDASTVKDINNWCYNHTTGKIEKIIDSIPRDTVFYLINALDFDAKWEVKYERKDLLQGTFHNYNGTDKDVTLLSSEESRYFIDDNSVGFTKNYMGAEYSFMALLPDEGVDVYDYVASLDSEKWAGLWESADVTREDYQWRKVYAKIPEFKYEADLSLRKTLETLGLTDMFTPGKADFSNLDDTQALYCDAVEQKTMIELDRNGTKAAAITWAAGKCMSAAPDEPLYITLDRPFVYAIIDNDHQLPLFMGVVTNL